MTAHCSPLSGTWYPGRQLQLAASLAELTERSIERVGPEVLRDGVAFVVPHAAPRYCGAVAAAAYRHIAALQPRRAFVLGFSHRDLGGGLRVPSLGAYRTPLGDAPVDESAIRALAAEPLFELVDEADICDHSIEVQVPYLQTVNPGMSLVPICVGYLDARQRGLAAEAVAAQWRPGDVLVASSDLTHYGPDFGYVPFPNDARVAGRLQALDDAVIDGASSLDSDVFLEAVCRSGATACGIHPIALLLRILSLWRSELYQAPLDYQTSGEITGDFTDSVSYGALGYFPRASFEVSAVEQTLLLRSARETLDALRRSSDAEPVPAPAVGALRRRAPAFVTLRHGGRVIGCVGRLDGDAPLAETVPELALSAALYDPRRLPAVPAEAHVEISLLTPLRLIRDAGAVRIGIDGACVAVGDRRGVLLPQALRSDWSADDLLDALMRKAGVPHSKTPPRDCRIFSFGAQVFS